MIRDIALIKVPFKRGIIWTEKNVPFLFKIMTLERACDDLGVEFGELFSSDKTSIKVYSSLLWAAYQSANMEMRKSDKYSREQSDFWSVHMNQLSRDKVTEEINELMGKLKDGAQKTTDNLKKKSPSVI
jgi:hypothetical protein